MLIEVESLKAAGKAYTRYARMRGLPPSKEPLQAVPGRMGPVRVLCLGVFYTLCRKGTPVPAA